MWKVQHCLAIVVLLHITMFLHAQFNDLRIPGNSKPPKIETTLPKSISMVTAPGNPYKTISIVAGSGINKRDEKSHGLIDGAGTIARFNRPVDIISDGAGNFYIADMLNYRIRRMTADGIVTTWAGAVQGQEDGTLTGSMLYSPVAICIDKQGDLLVADKDWNAIRKISKTGIETIAGGNGEGVDNGDAKTLATFNRPVSIAVNSKNEIFICDEGNHVIRKISAGSVSTFAGTGNGGYADGPVKEADFLYPKALAIDANDNIYVAEETMIRKITPDGIVSTLAGKEGVQGRRDGKGTAASFSRLGEITVSPSGILFVVDNGITDALSREHEVNLRYRGGGSAIRMVFPDGRVQTVAGSYIYTDAKDFANWPQAKNLNDGPVDKAFFFDEVFGICLDKDENIYVTDAWLNCIRRISK